jgi:hypothetical protein
MLTLFFDRWLNWANIYILQTAVKSFSHDVEMISNGKMACLSISSKISIIQIIKWEIQALKDACPWALNVNQEYNLHAQARLIIKQIYLQLKAACKESISVIGYVNFFTSALPSSICL